MDGVASEQHALSSARTIRVARAFDSAVCRSMLDGHRPLLQRSSPLRTHHNSNVRLTVNGTVSIWVRNLKAGSTTIYRSVKGLMGPSLSLYQVMEYPYRPRRVFPDDTFVWTAVREPMARSLSAYAEVMRRYTHFAKLRLSGEFAPRRVYNWSAGRFNPKVYVGRNVALWNLSRMSCQSPADATRRYARFLENIMNGVDMGDQVTHAWPQAHVIDLVAPRERFIWFDAIAELERLDADMREILPRLGARLRARTLPRLNNNSRKDADPCLSGLNFSDARLRRLVHVV